VTKPSFLSLGPWWYPLLSPWVSVSSLTLQAQYLFLHSFDLHKVLASQALPLSTTFCEPYSSPSSRSPVAFLASSDSIPHSRRSICCPGQPDGAEAGETSHWRKCGCVVQASAQGLEQRMSA
jgi:hypothetical protein